MGVTQRIARIGHYYVYGFLPVGLYKLRNINRPDLIDEKSFFDFVLEDRFLADLVELQLVKKHVLGDL